MDIRNRVAGPLLALRLSVFIVMLMWTLDKFVNPTHAENVFSNFYGLGGFGEVVFLVIGVAELIIIGSFLVGYQKRWSYGAVLVLHAVSTFASYRQYMGFGNLLFFAAWPMLAACYVLYMLRDLDTMWAIGRTEATTAERVPTP
jgi:hypothetical protein